MNWKPAQEIADAVLYEGYLLYPYRASALKNRARPMFGTVPPGGALQAEVLLRCPVEARLAVKLRFLEEGEGREVVLDEMPVVGERRAGVLRCRGEAAADGLLKVRVRVENDGGGTLGSCHVLLGAEGGAFLSATDPRSRACECAGLWPVLVASNLALAAPIILPDYPSVAPESPRDLFDLTEIDEILTLRIRTLTDREKEEVRRGDERARRLLERADGLSGAELMALHGTARGPKAGDRVRLRPKGRADILDLAFEGKAATVVSVEQDLEGRRYLAVTVDDDPGRDLGERGFLGHRFFFRPEEVEAL